MASTPVPQPQVGERALRLQHEQQLQAQPRGRRGRRCRRPGRGRSRGPGRPGLQRRLPRRPHAQPPGGVATGWWKRLPALVPSRRRPRSCGPRTSAPPAAASQLAAGPAARPACRRARTRPPSASSTSSTPAGPAPAAPPAPAPASSPRTVRRGGSPGERALELRQHALVGWQVRRSRRRCPASCSSSSRCSLAEACAG